MQRHQRYLHIPTCTKCYIGSKMTKNVELIRRVGNGTPEFVFMLSVGYCLPACGSEQHDIVCPNCTFVIGSLDPNSDVRFLEACLGRNLGINFAIDCHCVIMIVYENWWNLMLSVDRLKTRSILSWVDFQKTKSIPAAWCESKPGTVNDPGPILGNWPRGQILCGFRISFRFGRNTEPVTLNAGSLYDLDCIWYLRTIWVG